MYNYMEGPSPTFPSTNSKKFRSYFADSRLDTNTGSPGIITPKIPSSSHPTHLREQRPDLIHSPFLNSENPPETLPDDVQEVQNGSHYWSPTPGCSR